ncbi:YqcC family protein [Alteromonas sp. KUL49]|uniref:YqcC family protein n=1 Tax=Alteromonas sp. KUL49 TaxID=2480798 RepID=UPI00102EF703|nr:YqcC family protein [Alteromonas sp. KUL49]TAP39615.1 YqcC family protein [Alteromonas sp. KUL49]GEA11591.1 hypothetical protein KUL49_19660 [Alteromonas sp. KUL49]
MSKNVGAKRMTESLFALTEALKANDLWPSREPTPYELASTVPFSVDRLQFNEWLAFVFCPKLLELIEQDKDIPAMAITPALDVYLPDCPYDVKKA